ncbi:MAG TPA: aldehyde dehydrogenase family protein [Gammaproteobacteria bacterium]|nr:aldehyde dehydrogenase family protein [Gammaproteobacteria bacterium]
MTEAVEVVQAWDRAVIRRLELVGWADIDAWLDTAGALCRDRARLPAWERVALLRRLAELMRGERDDLALMIAREGGKPLIDARVETDRAIAGVEIAAGEIERLAGAEIPMDLTAGGAGRLAFTRREPLGPVVAISAFNHPLNLIVHQVAPAIAVGAPVIVKPAITTPLSCLRFVALAHEAGLDGAWCRAAICDTATAERMATDGRVAFFSFIGSGRIGWMLRSKLAPGTRCALEHGGVAPVILGADADLGCAIPALVKGGYYHAGQVCVSVQRIFADARIREEVVERMKKAVEALRVGDPTEETTDVGPLIRPAEVSRVDDWVKEAVEGGATIVCGGRRVSDTAYAPTVLDRPGDAARISTSEVFGPVTCIYEYDDVDEAIRRANALPFAFQAAVFAQDIDFALHCAVRLDASAVMINDHTAFRVDWMPFAGLKQSGYGVGGIPYSMHDMTFAKMTVIKSPAFGA